MIIVADSSPLISFAIIDKLELLKEVYEEILIPEAVFKEISIMEKPYSETLKKFFKDSVTSVKNTTAVKLLLDEIDLGEAEAIVLALEKGIKYILIDDYKGRKKAKNSGLNTIGTAGTLVRAKELGKIDSVKYLLNQLVSNGIRIGEELYNQILITANEN